ncbi:YncE family protein [Gordonia sp. (in: high G+C Gram-positive bacteria)]|uniref:YncE family protein n=1 Tax=Gordonia sp. (in: high G+C Gram-positive bacteria) TaxID=84139 RepID=UPI003528D7DF
MSLSVPVSRPSRPVKLTTLAVAGAGLLAVLAPAVGAGPQADAAPGSGWNFRVSSAPAGVKSGAELAINDKTRKLFITDSFFTMQTKGGSNVSFDFRALQPGVTKFSITKRKPVGKIDYAPMPWGLMPFGPVPVVPTPQVPDGIGVDNAHSRIVSTASHANGVTIVSQNATTTNASNLLSFPQAHPMGVAVDERSQLAYVAMNAKNYVSVIDTVKRREVAKISNIYMPSFLDIDTSRNRLYVGNADYNAKKTNYLTVVDTRTNAVIKKIPTPSNTRPQVDPATGKVFAASFDTGKIVVIDPNSLTVVKTIVTGTTPDKLAIDGQRRLVYTANLQRKTITVLNADTGAIITTLRTGAAEHSLVVDEKTGTVFSTNHQGGKLTIVSVTKK